MLNEWELFSKVSGKLFELQFSEHSWRTGASNCCPSACPRIDSNCVG